MLLNKRDLGLDRKFNVAADGVVAAIRSNAGQYPRASFLIHQAASAVDRIDDDAPDGVGFVCSSRQNDLSVFQAFGDENDRDF